MPTITIPHLSESLKPAFSKFGIELVDAIEPKAFEKVVVEYLDNHNVLNLATCKNNEPRCTTLEYFNDGLTVYILSEGGGKLGNIRKNPSVSYTVNDPYHPQTDFFGAVGLQVWGQASLFKSEKHPQRAKKILTNFRNLEGLEKQGLKAAFHSTPFNVITIEPRKMRYLNQRKGFRRVKWAVDK
jgi:hypothetical protein